MAEWVISPDTLRQILGMADVDLPDLDFVNDRKHQLPPRERAQAEQVVNAAAFRHWITVPSSAKLMVHWDQCRQVASVSSLTALCATMAAALKAQSGPFLFALWFCGRHHDRAEVQSDAFLGPRAMLSSLIEQLLRQYMFDMPAVSRCIDVATLQRSDGDLDAPGCLLTLLESLLLQLPLAVTLFFVIDGVVLYERAVRRRGDRGPRPSLVVHRGRPRPLHRQGALDERAERRCVRVWGRQLEDQRWQPTPC